MEQPRPGIISLPKDHPKRKDFEDEVKARLCATGDQADQEACVDTVGEYFDKHEQLDPNELGSAIRAKRASLTALPPAPSPKLETIPAPVAPPAPKLEQLAPIPSPERAVFPLRRTEIALLAPPVAAPALATIASSPVVPASPSPPSEILE